MTAHALDEAVLSLISHFDRLINEKYGGKRLILAGGSQEIFVYNMELRDAICKQFLSREIL